MGKKQTKDPTAEQSKSLARALKWALEHTQDGPVSENIKDAAEETARDWAEVWRSFGALEYHLEN